jgi:hypothetical protein
MISRRVSRALLAALVAVAVPAPGWSLTFTPIMQVNALGGQYYTGSDHSDGGNFDGSFVPVLGLTPSFYLIPVYLGSFHHTQSVYNFLGENTLIDKQVDQTLVLRAAWAFTADWRFKPRVGYRREWIKQSTDETLSTGLFNYYRAFGGASVERVLGNGSIEFSYEYGPTRYPNYQALDSDPRFTSTGITQSAGTDVLNFNAHETSIIYQNGGNRRLSLLANFTWVRENFVDQRIITSDEQGFQDFVDTNRKDDVLNLALQQSLRANEAWRFGMGETFQYYLSNQNAYDATQIFGTPYTYRYYNFFDLQVYPSLTRYWDHQRWECTLGGTFGYRQYAHRKAQDEFGTNTNDLIHSWNRGANLTVRYAIFHDSENRYLRGLYAVLTGTILTYTSNTRYEANYPYNYTVYNYLGGLSWGF